MSVNLDYEQRISIIITLPKKNGTGEVSFVSGWMVYPNGEIVLTTPMEASNTCGRYRLEKKEKL